jgi:hypothetical protein
VLVCTRVSRCSSSDFKFDRHACFDEVFVLIGDLHLNGHHVHSTDQGQAATCEIA